MTGSTHRSRNSNGRWSGKKCAQRKQSCSSKLHPLSPLETQQTGSVCAQTGCRSFARGLQCRRSLGDPFAAKVPRHDFALKSPSSGQVSFLPAIQRPQVRRSRESPQMLSVPTTACYNRFRLPLSGAECWRGDFRLPLTVLGSAILFDFTKILSLLSLIKGPLRPNLRPKGPTMVDACISAPNDWLHAKLGKLAPDYMEITLVHFVFRCGNSFWWNTICDLQLLLYRKRSLDQKSSIIIIIILGLLFLKVTIGDHKSCSTKKNCHSEKQNAPE